MKEYMYKLEDCLSDKLEEICESGNVSRSDLQDIHMLTGAMANIEKIEKYERESSYGDWRANGSYGRDGYSGRDRHYVRGHYSYGDDRMMSDRMMPDKNMRY